MKTSKSACRVIEGRMIKSRIGLKGCQSALPQLLLSLSTQHGAQNIEVWVPCFPFWTDGNSENCNCWYLQYSYRKIVIFGGSKKIRGGTGRCSIQNCISRPRAGDLFKHPRRGMANQSRKRYPELSVGDWIILDYMHMIYLSIYLI